MPGSEHATETGLILASGSPRRQALLKEAGYRFAVVSPEVEEEKSGTYPFRKLCTVNAALKAREVHLAHPHAVVIAADTMVGLDGQSLGKPRDIVDTVCMLKRLAGRVHEVCTGVCIIAGEEERVFFEVTWVQFQDFDEEVIREYTQQVQVLDKAGSYAIQDRGEMLVEKVEGAYDNVVGLPVGRLVEELVRMGIEPGGCASE